MLPRKRADLAGAGQLMSLTGITVSSRNEKNKMKKSFTLILCFNLRDVCACRENISKQALLLFLKTPCVSNFLLFSLWVEGEILEK